MTTFDEFMKSLDLLNEGLELLVEGKKASESIEKRHEEFKEELAKATDTIELNRKRSEEIRALCNEKFKGINKMLANM